MTLVGNLGPARLLLYAGLGAGMLSACWPAERSRYRRALEQGPLQPWTLDAKSFPRWLLIRSARLFGVVSAIVVAFVVAVRPPEALVATPALALGGLLMAWFLWRKEGRPRPLMRGRTKAVSATGGFRQVTSAASAWRLVVVAALRRRGLLTFRGFEALALLALTSAIAGLVARNNASPSAGVGVALVGAVLASAVIRRSDPRLTRLLGLQPIGLPRLWWLLHGPLSLIAALGAAACVWAAGLGWLAGIGIGLTVLILQAGLGALQVLHGVGRPPRLASISLGADLIGGSVFLSLFGSWTVPLAILRFWGLVRGAQRRRWNG